MNAKVTLVQAFGNGISMLLPKRKTFIRIAILFLTLNFFSETIQAQCSLGCNDNVQVSLDNFNCQATITVAMISPTAANSCPGGNFSVVVMNTNGSMLSTSPIVTGNEVGKKLNVKIIDNVTGNSCWGSIIIEDKLAPNIVCVNDTVPCNANINAVGVIKAPIATDNCTSNVTVTYTDVMNDLPCTSTDYTAIITRTYTAKDAIGNTATCVKYIYLKKGKLSDVVFPKHRDGVQAPVLDCVNANTNPSNTGEPTINGQPLSVMCDLMATSNDQERPGCAGTKIILRNWIVMDWCSGVAQSYIQYIKIDDKTAPTMTCPKDITLNSKSTSCVADYTFPTIVVSDNCSPTSKVTLSYNATAGTINGNKILGLPLGVTTVTVTATDDCGNNSNCSYKITVRDFNPPVAVCAGLKKVSLGLDGMAEIGAASFDDGSVDNCGIDRFEVSRMGTSVNFSSKIKFDCDDVNDTITVILRVWDVNGNFNDCMTSVFIEDKLAPIMICPPDLTMSCRADYENLNLTGGVVATDNCEVYVKYKDVSSLNNCGVGSVRRTWTATDKGGRTAQCIQNIYLINTTPFYINSANPFDPNDDVTWPADFIGSTCGASLLPAVTGAPIVKSDDCDQIAVTYEDTDIPAQSGGCKQILRKWIIVDFCQFKPNTTPRVGYWEYTQNIRITNNEPPKISFDCKDITVGLDDKDCLSKKFNMVITANDDCSDASKLSWTQKIDFGNDGFYERISNNGDISGDYPYGTSVVYISVSDGCGNVRSCSFKVHVIDVKKPTAVCHHGLSASLMATGMVPLTAKMFDGGSFDNCTAASDLVFNIIPNNFTCKNVGPNLVTFTVTDKSGNQDFCTTYVDIQDNMKMCPDSVINKAAIAGAIMTTNSVGVEKVDIMVNGAMSQITTSNTGNYMLYKALGLSYVVKPEKNDDLLNGVSTFDVVRLSRHILGTEVLTNPYALVAADVNKSNTITAADMVALRRAILGISKTFAPTQGSWRFIKKDYVFPTVFPFLTNAIPESHQMSLVNNMTSDFIAVKIGDLNGNAKANNLTSSTSRGLGEALVIETDDILMEAGKTYRIPFIIKEKDLTGIQFTLKYNDKVSLTNIKAGNLVDMTDANLAVIENGTITTSWNTNQSITNEATYAYIDFKANETTYLSEVLDLNSVVTSAEAYSTDDELKNVTLQFTKRMIQEQPKGVELYQNQPNPFSEVTRIRFYLPESTSATISVMDITGKIVYQTTGEYSSGIQTVSLNKAELSNFTSGIFYYELKTSKTRISKKMITVE
jgi:hypothetical protein